MYPQILSQLSMHTHDKPAGPLLYFTALIDLLGYNDRTAIISGACIGLISTFSIVATYWLAKLLSGNLGDWIPRREPAVDLPRFHPEFSAVRSLLHPLQRGNHRPVGNGACRRTNCVIRSCLDSFWRS